MMHFKPWSIRTGKGCSLIGLPLLFLLFLSACQSAAPLTPEQAAMNAVLTFNSRPWQMKPETLSVVDVQPVGEKAMVLLAFEATDTENQDVPCVALYEAVLENGAWEVKGHPECLGSPRFRGAMSALVTFDARPGQTWTSVYGLVGEEETSKVQAAWQDGFVQEMEIGSQSAFLFLRDYEAKLVRLVELDADGVVVNVLHEPIDPARQIIVDTQP